MKTEYRGEVWVDALMQAQVHGTVLKRVQDETMRYAIQYLLDSPVVAVKFSRKRPGQRWRNLIRRTSTTAKKS